MTEAKDSLNLRVSHRLHEESSTLSGDYEENAVPRVQLEGRQEEEMGATRNMSMGVAIAVDPVALIDTECITVTSAMRKHARWAYSSVSAILGSASSPTNQAGLSRFSTARSSPAVARHLPNGPTREAVGTRVVEDESLAGRWGLRGRKGKSMQDSPLMSAFAQLRNDLRGCKGKRYSQWRVTLLK